MGNTLLLGLLASFMCAGYSSKQEKGKSVPEEEVITPEVLEQASSEEDRRVVDE